LRRVYQDHHRWFKFGIVEALVVVHRLPRHREYLRAIPELTRVSLGEAWRED
jgi:hypothetical protein